MNINFLKLAKFFIYLVPFSVLIVLPSNFFPFIGGKYYFFRTAVSLSLVSLLFHWAFEDKENKIQKDLKQIFHHPLVMAVTAFVLFYVLASIFALDPQAAFWSNFERQEGGFQMIHYWLFFILLILLFKKEDDWKNIFWISIISAIGMIGYGILSAGFVPGFFGPYNSLVNGTSTPGFLKILFNKDMRFQGSLGNPAYVAPYLMFIIFYALYLWFKEKPKFDFRGISYILLVLFFGTFFVLSQTRGAFLGLVSGILVFFGFLIFKDKNLRKIGFGGLLIILILGGLVFYFKDSSLIQNLPGARFLKIDLKEQTAQTRFWTWNSAWRGFLDRPILGWGPENFPVVFDKYFDTRHFNPQTGGETWFDRAHSAIFDYLAETGILGAISYLSIFVIFLVLFFKYFKNKNQNNKNQTVHLNNLQLGLILAIITGYFVQNLIIFEVLPMYLNFFLTLGLLVYLFKQNELSESLNKSTKK
jgi:O-antigen ligase